MGYNIVNDKNEIIGWSADEFDVAKGQRLVPEGCPIKPPTLDELKAKRVARIKEEVLTRLNDMLWRVDRARERDLIGAKGESLAEVYAAREAVRIAGNRAEKEVQALKNAADVEKYTWEVTPADYHKPSKITRLAFVRRFSTKEREALSAAREKSHEIDDWWKLLDLAINVDLRDNAIMTGVHYLEKIKLIGPGRAKEILSL